jgi:hypothetical protein
LKTAVHKESDIIFRGPRFESMTQARWELLSKTGRRIVSPENTSLLSMQSLIKDIWQDRVRTHKEDCGVILDGNKDIEREDALLSISHKCSEHWKSHRDAVSPRTSSSSSTKAFDNVDMLLSIVKIRISKEWVFDLINKLVQPHRIYLDSKHASYKKGCPTRNVLFPSSICGLPWSSLEKIKPPLISSVRLRWRLVFHCQNEKELNFVVDRLDDLHNSLPLNKSAILSLVSTHSTQVPAMGSH